MRRELIILVISILFATPLFSQIKVDGKITSRAGEPLPGVNVVIKGTTTGTISDIDGTYSLNQVPINGTLLFSFIGMTQQEISVAGQTRIDVVLSDDVLSLDEVVAIGYGTVRKRDLTGAVSSVKGEEITMAPVNNVMEALQGRVAGLDITRTSGRSGSEPEVLLRGNRSLTANSGPLYIIDGIPGSIATLNPNDIQSIEILKDASSTAIYGSAGANGVIIVTTKQAEKGKVQIDFDSYVGVNGFAQYPKGLMGDEWINYLNEGYVAAYGKNPESRNDLFTAYSLAYDDLSPYINAGKWIDWVDETLQTGIQQNHNLSIRGGTERTQAYFSMGLNSEQGIYKDDRTDIITLRTGITHTLNDWMKAGVQTTMSWRDRNQRNSRLNRAFSTIPLGDVYDADGNILREPINNHSTVSPIADDIPGVYTNNSKQIRVMATPFLEISPMKGLTYRTILGTNLFAQRSGSFENEFTYMKLSGSGSAMKSANYNTSLAYSYTWENIVNYNFKVAQHHDFTLTGITSWNNSQSENSSIFNEGFDYDDFIYYNMNAGINPRVGSGYSQTKKMSYAARVNYSYKGKYLLTLSNRWDGASQLAQKWDFFPAGAFAWRISDEPFMAATRDWMSNLKLRVGYGITGNANISPYVTSTEVQSSDFNLNLGSGQVQVYVPTKAVGNTALRWEKSYNTNIGIDLGLFDQRIELALELYDTDTRDVIFDRPLPTSNGAYSGKVYYNVMSNIAHMNNRGIEVTLTSRNVAKKDFQWNTSLTFAINREQVVDIDLGNDITATDLIALNLFLGQPKNTIYGYKKLGIWQTNEAEEAAKYKRVPGEVRIETVEKIDDQGVSDNGIHEYSVADRQILGAKSPDWTMGFQNSFYYKNFDLNIFMTARWGQLVDADILGYFKYSQLNIPANYDYWTPENATNNYPRPNILGNRNDVGLNSLSITDGSFLKIRNISLGYTIPKNFGQQIGIEKLRIYGTVSNPYIYAKSHLMRNIDPETGGSDSFPLYKQIVFGINLTF